MRLFLIGMLVLPLVALIALWGVLASITLSAAIKNQQYNKSTNTINAGITPLILALPQERQDTFVWLLSGRHASDASLAATRKQVDKAIPPFRGAVHVEENLLSASSKASLTALDTGLGQIGQIRQQVDSGTLAPADAFQAYSNIIDAEFHYFTASTEDRGGSSLAAISVGAADGAYSLEMTAREAALINGALSTGQLSPGIRSVFSGSAALRKQLLSETIALVPPKLDAAYVNDSPAYRQFLAMESQILASTGTKVPVDAKAWQSATQTYLASTQKRQEFEGGGALAAMSAAQGRTLVTEAILAGGVGLAVVVVSVVLLLWFGRKVTRDMAGLNRSVREMAEERLPRVVDRLRKGEDVDVQEESPAPGKSSILEISDIAESFATVQSAAVGAAVDQARLRKGINQLFTNISMRNQSLLHRQLGMLDAMERRTGDPQALAELFRLDHLTTRMRRHAEGLIILAGSTPGRGWRDPVPAVDVLRAAVAEVEDYVRVDVVSESQDMVLGNAVNDIIHLVAELVENATVFSPPNTRVEVRAERVGTGLVAEIEDRGLGLSEPERDEINHRLVTPPEFDLASSDQLGLFIVSQLAARHGIKVSLRESIYGGTTAIVRIPFGVIVREDNEVPGPPLESDDLQAAAAGGSSRWDAIGRHRLPTAATGRVADFDGDRAADDEAPAPGASSLPPWELSPPAPQPEAGTQAASPAGNGVSSAGVRRSVWERPPKTPWPGPGRTDTTAPLPRVASAEPKSVDPVSTGTHLGMPIRVPRASLAPQLRSRPGQQTLRASTDVDLRAPEAMRDLMRSMQEGWQRGRNDDLDDPIGAPDGRTDR